MTIALPEPLFRSSSSQRCLEDVMRTREPRYEKLFAPGQEQLGHFYLAPFQRPAVWTDAQSARLIESVHLGIAIGSIVVSDCGNARRTTVDGVVTERFPPTADWLIDGQQRLRAISRYLADDLVVFSGEQAEHRFSQLDRVQQRRFLGSTIGYIKLEPMPLDALARVYDLLNFGGTRHDEDQRASGQDTD